MAETETLNSDNNMTLYPPLTEVPHPHEDETKIHESGEEYSSGSDRSFEADNTDDSRVYENSGTSDTPVVASRIRAKKRRHGSHGSRRQKGGSRHKHRPYQPYPDSGVLETSLKRKSQELQEKETATAMLRQEGGEDQFVTFPVAPFNSTQFLMDEHTLNSPKGVSKTELGGNSPVVFAQDVPALSSLHSNPRNDQSDNFERLINCNRKDQEFSDIYSSVHAENLQSMPKEELVKHYMSLEEQVALLQEKVAQAEQRNETVESDVLKRSDDCDSRKDSVPNSDTSSLSSGNEEFVDIVAISHSTENSASGKVVQEV